MSRANAITKAVIDQINLQGGKAFRVNTMGIFDLKLALTKIHELVMFNQIKRLPKLADFIKENTRLIDSLKKSYRTSSEELGKSDILGYTKHGVFIAVEIKAKGDKLDKDGGFNQENFLKEVGQKGGISFIVAEEPQKIKLRVLGSSQYITICHPDDFLRLFRLRLDEPF
jgi:hypothetical protein